MKEGRLWLRVLTGVVASALLAAGCTGDGTVASQSPSGSPAPTVTVTETVTEQPSVQPSSSAPTTAAPAGPSPSATAASEARVVLGPDGLGVVRFGDSPEVVIAALDGRYGPADEDSGWGPRGSFGVCPGSTTRGVRYGQLLVLLSDGPTEYAGAGQPHMFSYTVFARNTDNPAAEYGDGPQTAHGIGVGSSVADLRAAFGEALEVRDDIEVYGPEFSVAEAQDAGGDLNGSLTDITDDGLVISLSAGQLCGE